MLATKVIRFVDKFIQPLIWISVGLLFWEISLSGEHSLEKGLIWFLWIERTIAAIFTAEYIARWYEDRKNPDGSFDLGLNYPLSAMGIIDLISILPFWIGFFVPVGWLGWIRAFRIFRLLKMFRYWRSLQIVALGFYKSWYFLKPLMFSMLIVSLFSAVIMHQAEHTAQPEAFGDVFNCFWFSIVSATTVGYGDMSPATLVGKVCCAVILFVPAIFIFAAIVGTIGNGFAIAMDLEKDPSIDPIDEFKKIWQQRHS